MVCDVAARVPPTPLSCGVAIQPVDPGTLLRSSTTTPRPDALPRGSEDLSGSFDRSSHFYERSERSEGSGGSYLRRSGSASGTTGGYHATESLSRSRARDRLYRNGPYTAPLLERDSKQRIGEPRKSSSENDELVRHSRVVSRSQSSHHRVGSSWGYDSPSPRYSSQVPSTPELPYSEERRETTPVVHKKHSKSSISRRSGSDTGSNSGSSRSRSSSASSQSGSSTCSTASSSPTSEKSCSTHSQQSTLRSGPQSAVSTTHTNSGSPAVHSEDRRPLAICVRNLPARSSDTSLKDGLYHEYKKHGKVTWVKVVGQGVDRYALVCFKKPEDVDKALQVSHDKLFFGCKIEVAPYQGYDVDDNEFRPFEAEQDEFHPKATRTLFIGNLEKDITTQEIRKHFDQFGEIIDIDIKKQGTSSSYAFCQFSDIGSVVRAMRTLDGEHIGSNRIKLGFGKSMHTNSVWVDGVSDTVSEKYLSQQFGQFGPVSHVVIDRVRGHALVIYEQIAYAQQAVKEMRGVVLRGRKLQVDYASRECQEAFYDRMEKQSSTSHPSFENNVQASPQSTVSANVRVFDGQSAPAPAAPTTPSTRYASASATITGGSRYNTSGSTSRSYSRPTATSPATSNTASPSTSIRSSRHSTTQRFDFSDYITERRSYRSYEDAPPLEEGSTLPTSTGTTTIGTGAGDIRHLQKERVALLEQLEDCTSSGEEGAGRRRCKHRRSQSGEGSRPGTPLCDERPENLPPVEPRRAPRDRPPDPLSLPLPRFASQVLSPRPAPPSPPASPQTPHSSSSDSEPSPPSPEWEERLRSLDEKYEKWSGTRTGITKVDPSTLKVRHKLLDLDLHELQPSDIVKSVLAKRSVFDEDSKRLENFSDKYEPREFVPASRANVLRRLDMSPLSSPVSKSPGLQYPFPSHPPAHLSSSVVTPTTPTPPPALSLAADLKPSPVAPTFLTNCSRLLQPKISSPSSTSIETSPRPSTQPPDKFKPKCPIPQIKKETPPIKPKPCPIRRDSVEEKTELRRKSRDETVLDSVIKKDDTSESDKVKDAQVCERRKSAVDKRRNSVESRDSISKDNLCDRPKDFSDKREDKERRRGSSDLEQSSIADAESAKQKDDLKRTNQTEPIETQPSDGFRNSEQEKFKKINDSIERRKESETVVRHNSTDSQDKKKDVLGVNSERDRRRGRESVDSSNDNPKHRKVPEIKKDVESFVDKRDKEEDVNKFNDSSEKRKDRDSIDSISQQSNSKNRDKKDHISDRDKRRDSSDVVDSKNKSERSPDQHLEVTRHKDQKRSVDNYESKSSKRDLDGDISKSSKKDSDLDSMKNSKRDDFDNELKKEPDIFKHKDIDRRKNSDNEISKEHSLFKKVFGFADSIRHHKERRDSETGSVKTDTQDNFKHRDRRDHSTDKDKKKDKDVDNSDGLKHKSRKSPDNPDNIRHKEDKKKFSESSERKKKDFDLNDDGKQKESESTEPSFHLKSRDSDRKKDNDRSKDKNMYMSSDGNSEQMSKANREAERRKEFLIQEDNKKLVNDIDFHDGPKVKDSDSRKDNDIFYERRKDNQHLDGIRNKENDRRKESYLDNSLDKYFDRIKDDHSKSSYKDIEKKNDSILEAPKFKHADRHRDSERKSRDHESGDNCRTKDSDRKRDFDSHERHKSSDKRKDFDSHRQKEDKKTEDIFDNLKQKDSDRKREDSFESIKSKDDYSCFRDSSRKKDMDNQDISRKDISERKKEDKERRKERELKEALEERRRERENEKEKSKKNKDYDVHETKVNGDHDGEYNLDNVECRKTSISYEENDHRMESSKKEKRRDKNSWPATIGFKRRLSSQDSLDILPEDPKRIKPERRDSKDSGRSSGSSRKGSGEKHNKGFTKLLEEKIKEDKEREMRKKDEQQENNRQEDDKTIKPAIRKEKRNSGEKRKEERKFKHRLRENGTASDSDLGSGDEESKAPKRQQHSIFDIVVDDEPAYISMYDKVKARSTKNMQKQEEEKRQEKLKEKFHQLKQSRAKREEKKRSTSYDEDSDSEKGSIRRSNKLLLTSSEDDVGSDTEVRIRSKKVLYDTSEDDMVMTPRPRKNVYISDSEVNKCGRKIVSDVSEDDIIIKHSTPKVKSSRNISFDSESKPRKIMSDTSEDDNSRLNITSRLMNPIRIHSDESEGDLGFEDSIRTDAAKEFALNEIYSNRPAEVNHFKTENNQEQPSQPLQSSPETFRINSIDCNMINSEQPRKKSHKKKQKRQKNFEENEDGTIKKHSSKKDKKKSHRDNEDEDKKSRKKRSDRESSNKREEKLEDIFGPLSDDSEKAMGKWQVSQVYGSDSESERENIRKKEKKIREKKFRELVEVAFGTDFMGGENNIVNSEEHVKTKKKKRKKSRDEKFKHHQRLEEGSVVSILPKENLEKSHEIKIEPITTIKEEKIEAEIKTEKEQPKVEAKLEIKSEVEDEEMDKLDKPQSISSLLDSLLDSPPATQTNTPKKPDIPGFGSEVDENIHETAVKSISESPCTTLDESDIKFSDKSKSEEPVAAEDKPTPIISQEETEDAVAALLLEDAFSGGFEGYSEGTPKPDTPVSEPDLQIDTDTEDTFDPIDFSRPPRTPDIPTSFYRQNDTREGLEERIMSLACSSDTSSKDSSKTLQMPPTPDLKIDKKLDSSDSDSFDLDKSMSSDKDSIVKNLMDIDASESDQEQTSSSLKDLIPDLVKLSEDSESQDTLPRSELSMEEDKSEPMDIKESESTPVTKLPEIPPKAEELEKRDEPKLITPTSSQPSLPIIQLTVPTISVPTLVPLTTKLEPSLLSQPSQNVQKLERVNHQQTSAQPINTVLVQQPQPQTAQVVKPIQPPPTNPSTATKSYDLLPLPVQTPSSPSRMNPPSSPGVFDIKPPSSTAQTVQSNIIQATPASVAVQPKAIEKVNIIQNNPPAQHSMPAQFPPGLQQPLKAATHRLPFPYTTPTKPNQMPVVTQVSQALPNVQVKPTVVPSAPIQPPILKPLIPLPLTQLKESLSPTNLPIPSLTPPQPAQKQLHIVTQNAQILPQPPVSPQNMKVRPIIAQPLSNHPPPLQNINVQHLRPPIINSSNSQTLNRLPNPPSIPLLQTVKIDDLKPCFSTSKSQLPLPNSLILHTPIQSAPHPERVINLSPSQPITPVPQKTPPSVIKSSPNDLITNDWHLKKVEHAKVVDLKSRIIMNDIKSTPLTTQEINNPVIKSLPTQPPKTMPLVTNSIEQAAPVKEVQEPIILTVKKSAEDCKPLNAVIQDLTLRAANKAMWKQNPAATPSESKVEPPKPIEIVVRELAMRKKASVAESKEPEKPTILKEKQPQIELSVPKVRIEPPKPEVKPVLVEEVKETKVTPLPLIADKLLVEQPKEKSEKVLEKVFDEAKVEKVKEEPSPEVVKTSPIQENKPSPVENKPPPVIEKKQSPSVEKKIIKNEESVDNKSPKKEVETPPPQIPEEKVSVKVEMHTTPVARGGKPGRKKKSAAGGVTRGGGVSTRRTRLNNTAPAPSTDIYEFRDDSEEETGRPRLILTIKSPPEQPAQVTRSRSPQQPQHPPPAPAVTNTATPTTTRKSRRLQVICNDIESISQSKTNDDQDGPNTRRTRSKRHQISYQEKDGSRNTVDDTIDDVIRGRPGRRATRSTAQTLTPPVTETVRKSPRRKQQQQNTPAPPQPTPPPPPPPPPPVQQQPLPQSTPPAAASPPPPVPVQTPPTPANQLPTSQPMPQQLTPQQTPPPVTHQAVPTAQPQSQPLATLAVTAAPVPTPLPQSQQSVAISKLIRAGLQPNSAEPTTLIDPVTGLLIPMRESEEGQYIPVLSDLNRANCGNAVQKEPSEGEPPEKRQRLVQADEAIARTTPARPSVVRPTASQTATITAVTTASPTSHVAAPKVVITSSHSFGTPMDTTPARVTVPLAGSVPPRSHPSVPVLTPKAHLLQAVAPSRVKLPPVPTPPPAQLPKGPTPMTPKAHILQSIGNAQAREVVVGSPAPHQGSLLTGSVASPPLRAHQQPIVTGASSARVLLKAPPSEGAQASRIGDGSCIVVASPSAQSTTSRSQVMQAGMPIPAFEASLHGVVAELHPNPQWSSQAPPPAHQQQQGEVQHVNYPPHHIQPAHYVHSPFVYHQQFLRDPGIAAPYHRPPGPVVKGSEIEERVGGTSSGATLASPPLELRRGSPHDRATDSPQVANVYMHGTGRHIYYDGPPPPPAHRPQPPPGSGRLQVATPPHASQVPPQADSLLMLLQRYPVMWQGLLALKNDQAAVQMHFVFGNPHVARDCLPCNSDGSTPPLRIAQRMRLEQTQVEGVARKMQTDNEHCMLLALPCGRDHMDVLQQSNNLRNGFITYLQQKQAAGIVNIAAPGSQQESSFMAAYVVHIFPACDFANESLARIAPDLLHRVADLAHLLIVIATV